MALTPSCSKFYLRSTYHASVLTEATRKLREGILIEGVHFIAAPSGFYFMNEECMELGIKALIEALPSKAVLIFRERPKE